MFELTDRPIDPAPLLRAVARPEAGAEILFLGVARRTNQGREVLHLEYEAYAPMALSALEEIGRALRARHGEEVRAAIVHRLGRVEIGETSVAIAVSAPRRDTAYAASRDAIETLKREVPIWKREHFVGGTVWVEGPGGAAPPPASP